MSTSFVRRTKAVYDNLMEDRRIKTEHLVDAAYSQIAHFQQMAADGRLGEAEAQQAALEALKAMRYAGSEYFWVNDLGPVMVMHPVKPELDGKYVVFGGVITGMDVADRLKRGDVLKRASVKE